MSTPDNLQYTASHVWVRTEAGGTLTVGITHHAQEALGDIVFIALPAIASQVQANQACGQIESVKTASDLIAPLNGVVTAVNSAVVDSPEKVNADPYAAWLFQMTADTADRAGLIDAQAYQQHAAA